MAGLIIIYFCAEETKTCPILMAYWTKEYETVSVSFIFHLFWKNNTGRLNILQRTHFNWMRSEKSYYYVLCTILNWTLKKNRKTRVICIEITVTKTDTVKYKS